MKILELIDQFKAHYGNKINPMLTSVKYCQGRNKAAVILDFNSGIPSQEINLNFICGDFEINEDREVLDILPLFDPNADIVDNATTLLKLDAYSMINCVTGLFTPEAAYEINDEHQNQIRK